MHPPTPSAKTRAKYKVSGRANVLADTDLSKHVKHLSTHLRTHTHFLYLNYTQHSVVNHQRGVVSWDDGANQNPLHELPRRHQNVKPVAAVLHARLQDLASNGGRGSLSSVK